MAKQAASQTKKPREKKTTDANGMPKEFDVSTAPRVSLEFGNAWFAVDRRSAEMPNLPMPTYQTGSKIYIQHTAENVAFLLTYNNVENRQWVETQWPNLYRATDNADRFDLMQQCKANESALVPALRKRLADGGFECWDWLRSHQVLCLYLGLLNNSLGLLLDMGVGKTAISLQIAANRIRRRDTEAVLLVIPATLYNTWQSEIDKLRAMYNDPIYELVQLSGVAEERRYQLKHCRGPFFAINYEMLAPLMPEICAKQFNMLIFDESSKIKSHTARMTQASWYLAQRARYKLILNGTPYSKSLTDLHSQLNVLQLGSLFKPLPPNPFVFEHRFMNKSGFNLTPKPGAVEAVNRALYSYSVRYVSEECLELPERTIQNVFCDMTPKQWDVYREVEAQAFTEVQDSVVKAENRLTTLSKVFQITSGFVNDVNGKPILFEPKAPKLEALREMIAGTDRSIIIFAWHVFLLEMLYDEYSKDAVLFHGGVSKNDKTLAEKKFQAGERRIFFGQEQAAGKGLNLQVAPYSIFLEKNHSYENYIQALKRNHRGGQKHPCFGYNLMVQDTIDTDIQDVVDARAVDADAALVTVTRNMARRVGRR